MRHFTQFSIILGLIMLMFSQQGCSQQTKDADETLSDKQKREQMMESIANDHEMASQMMDHMMASEHGKMIMQNDTMMNMMMQNREHMRQYMHDNPQMMRHMMGTMMNMAESDTAYCNQMSHMMMNDEHMRGMMMNMMQREGMKPGEEMENMPRHMHQNGDMH